jgi:hypothetical protein
MELTGQNRSTREKTCRSATLSTTNPTWTDPGSNTSLRGETPATNRLSHGTALYCTLLYTGFRKYSWRETGQFNLPRYQSQVLHTDTSLRIQVFWNVTLCRLRSVSRRCEGTAFLWNAGKHYQNVTYQSLPKTAVQTKTLVSITY